MKERILKLQGHADVLLNAYLGLRGNIELFKPLAYDKAAANKFTGGYRARGYMVVRRNLFFSCILDITRLSFDSDKRSPSVFNLMNALHNDSLRASLKAAYSRGESFDKLWEQLVVRWDDFNRQRWAEPFQSVRDKWVAHLEVRQERKEYKGLDISTLNLKWGDPEDAASRLEPIILNLMPVICNHGHIIDGVTEAYARAGKEFWDAC